jgi:hypothetical protein
MDDKGRLQTYPAIERLGSIPLAIIQSTNDSYVPPASRAARSGPTRRLAACMRSNRRTTASLAAGAADADIDAAMSWIAGLAAGDPH